MSVVVMATMKNVGPDTYSGDDKRVNNQLLRVKPGQEALVSLDKAIQLVKDYPQNWSFVSCTDKEGEKKILENIAVSAVTRRTFNRPAPAPTPSPSAPPSTVQQRFVQAALENRCQIETLTSGTPEFVKAVMGNGYVGAQTYSIKVPLLPNELGANMKKEIRYVLAASAPSNGKKSDSPEKKKGVEAMPIHIRPSRDIEPEALGAASGGSIDGADDKD